MTRDCAEAQALHSPDRATTRTKYLPSRHNLPRNVFNYPGTDLLARTNVLLHYTQTERDRQELDIQQEGTLPKDR